jgi:TonB-linked SusC/RagA family outer membrane protein
MRTVRKLVYAFLPIALLAPVALFAQATVSGRVLGASGEPLPSASVFIQGYGIGATTDADGSYSFQVPSARAQGQTATLTVRRIGYTSQNAQITLTNGSTISQNFALALNPFQLGEVVVTGAGTTSTAEKLGNVRNSVDSSLIRKSNESNIVNALAAKAPNVVVSSQSGEPGASSYLQIRGNRTIQSTGQPLFVVDGVPVDNTTYSTTANTGGTVTPNRSSDINPNDIESVEILKGSAAAAIYGAAAGQGVVMITTKSGHSGATKYSLQSNYSVDHVTHEVPLQTTYGQGFGEVGVTCPARGCRLGSTSWGPKLAAGTPTYDHFGELFRNGTTAENTLTASGGNDRTLFYISGTTLNQRGIIKGPSNEYDRTSVRLKASHRITDRFNVGGSVSYVDTRGKFIQKGSNISGLLLGALRTPPEFNNQNWLDTISSSPLLALHRSYRYPRPTATSESNPVGRGYDNPFFVLNRDVADGAVGRTFGNLNAEYSPNDWFTLRETLGADYYADERLEALPLTSSTFPQGQVNRLDLINLIIDHNLIATATRTFSPNFGGSLTLGNNLQSRHYKQLFDQGSVLIAPSPFQLNNTIPANLQNTEFESLIHTQSYFAQATLDLFNQLYLTGGVRNDGSSTFGASQKRHWFPKASAAWTFTNAVGDVNGIFPTGKLRIAYGQTGQIPPVYSTIGGLTTGSFVDGWVSDGLSTSQAGKGGLTTSTLKAQPNLGPEVSKELEGGIDLALWRNYADIGITLYNSKTEGVILLTPLAPSTGFTQQASNAARIQNTGTEITLNLRPIQNPVIGWDIGLQWGKNNNKVLDLAGSEYIDVAAGSFEGASGAAWKGSRVGVLRGFDFARCGLGLVIDGVDIDAGCGSAPKGALYIDASGFPITDPTNRIISDPQPKWTGSVRSSIQLWKNLTFSGLLDIRRGGQIWNGTKGALYFFGKAKDTENRYTDVIFGQNYMPAHPGASGVVAGPGAGTQVFLDEGWYTDLGSGFGQVSAQFVEDGGYAKLRELSLSYNLKTAWLNRSFGFESVDLRVAGRNLHTWTKYDGIDPETNLAGAEVLVRGIDYFNNPQTRSVVFSIGLNR